ncbi:MAG: hypothetical protein AAFY88_26455, partial [Acidobacteriota bacterium]
ALAAPAVLPFLEALPQTSDYHLRKHQHPPQSLSWSQVGQSALGAVYPHGWGEPWRGGRAELPGRFNAASGAFVGALALALALIGAAGGPRVRRFFGALAVVCFALAVGVPGLADVLASLPLFSLSLNGRLVFVTALALAVLAAFGFDLLRLEPGRGRIAAVVGAAAVLTVGGLWRLRAMEELGLATEGHWAALPWLLLAPLGAAISALVWRSPRGLGVLWLGLFLFSHRAELPRFYDAFEPALFYPPVAELVDLPRDGEPYRVIGRHYDLVPGQSALFEVEDMRGPAVMNHRRLAHLRRGWCTPLPAWFCRADGTDSALLDLFNVRFAVGDPASAPPADWPEVARGPRLAVYENPDVLPRAFAPRHVTWVGPEFPVVDRMIADAGFRDVAWLEDAGRAAGRQVNGGATVSTRSDGPDLWIDVDAAESAWVVVS